MFLSLLHQFFTPISSFPVSTPWAWCRVAWERTCQCILSLALPWYIRRRPNPNRGASLSSTTLTVRSLSCIFFFHLLFGSPYFLQHFSIHFTLPFFFSYFNHSQFLSVFAHCHWFSLFLSFSLLNVHSLTFSYHLICSFLIISFGSSLECFTHSFTFLLLPISPLSSFLC